jgi:hypothetical protein
MRFRISNSIISAGNLVVFPRWVAVIRGLYILAHQRHDKGYLSSHCTIERCVYFLVKLKISRTHMFALRCQFSRVITKFTCTCGFLI